MCFLLCSQLGILFLVQGKLPTHITGTGMPFLAPLPQVHSLLSTCCLNIYLQVTRKEIGRNISLQINHIYRCFEILPTVHVNIEYRKCGILDIVIQFLVLTLGSVNCQKKVSRFSKICYYFTKFKIILSFFTSRSEKYVSFY